MPFVTQALRSHKRVQPLFVGRAEVLRFFHQQVLSPDEPTEHLIGVWGPAGVGTSALLMQWREEARTAPFKGWCLTAFADGRMGSPLRVMTSYAAQLRASGAPLVAFEQLLEHITNTAFRPFSAEHQVARAVFVRHVQDLARSRPVQGLPVIGGMYEAVSETSRTTFLQQYPALQTHDGQDFQERLAALTRAFLDDLNWLAATPVRSSPQREQRIVLFLDEITAASSELLTWLRTQVLPASISAQVVLVLAGRDPLERLLPDGQAITSQPLHPFTEVETRGYLEAYGITDPAQTARLWRYTGGLPLALRLLAPVPPAWLNAEEDAITTGVRWIEQQGPGYRYLVRYAALFSKSFRHHDLAVCPMFSARERIQWYRLLIDLPFVQGHTVTGEHTYHPLVQQRVCQLFANEAMSSYQQARQALARHYQRQLEHLKRHWGEQGMRSEAGQELSLALLEQWFSLSDETSLMQAIEHIFLLVQQTADHGALTHLLRTFVQASSALPVPDRGKHVAGLLLAYSEADLRSPAFLEAMTELLELVGRQTGFSAAMQARFHGRRAAAWLLQEQPRRALEDSARAVALDPTYADGSLLRGMASAALSADNEAIAAFDQALSLDARSVFAYAHRGLAQRSQRAYAQAVEDGTQVLLLAPDLPEAAMFRGVVYEDMDERRRGLGNFDYRLEQNPHDEEAYVLQGMARCALGQYERALASFERALALDPTDPRIYAGRGHVHLERGDLERAQRDLTRSWELDAHDGTTGLLLAWVRLCREEPDAEISALLETLATSISQQDIALICRGIMLMLHRQFEEALAVLEQVIQLHPQHGEALFWKGLACVFLKHDSEALAALEQARSAEIPLPTVLFTPLRRVAAVRPDFYQEQVLPLLQEMEQRSLVI
jgi:tetratricopeptide (TPR) repeat protein